LAPNYSSMKIALPYSTQVRYTRWAILIDPPKYLCR